MNKGFIFIPLDDYNQSVPPKRNQNNYKKNKKNNNPRNYKNSNYKNSNYKNSNYKNNYLNGNYRKPDFSESLYNKNITQNIKSDINTYKISPNTKESKISSNLLDNFYINKDLKNKTQEYKNDLPFFFDKNMEKKIDISITKKDLDKNTTKDEKDDSFSFILPLNNDMNLKKPENIFSFFLNPAMENEKKKIEKSEEHKKQDEYRKKIFNGELIKEKISTLDDLIKLSESDKYSEDIIYNLDLKSLKKMNKPLKKLQSMIGLEEIKEKIFYQLVFYLQGLDIKNKDMLHSVISGPPGVGKTELARTLSEIYSCLGILSKGSFNIAKRSDLIGSYLGSTAMKTSKILEDSKGGVLFIDEAYSLGNSEGKDIYSKECIDTINQFLSENREDFICIIAGYKESLKNCFFNYNSGLERRFPWKYELKPYDSNQLKLIFEKIVNENEWSCRVNDDLFKKNLKEFKFFGGDMENLFHKTKLVHGYRALNLIKEEKRKINEGDLEKGYSLFMSDKDKKPNTSYLMYT